MANKQPKGAAAKKAGDDLADKPQDKTDKPLAKAPEKPIATKPKGGKIAGRGFENLEREDILLPRIKLLQAQSPELEQVEGLKPGTIFLNLSNKDLGTKVVITPILHFRSRIKWNSKDDGGGIDCSSPNAREPKETKYAASCAVCTHKNWNDEAEKKKDQAPSCTLYENFLVLVGDSTEAVILPMERTKTKVAKKFYSMMAVKGGDMWENRYELGVVKEKNANDEPYFNYTVSDTAKVKKTTPEIREACERFWQSLVDKDLTKNFENPDTEKTDGVIEGEVVGGGKY